MSSPAHSDDSLADYTAAISYELSRFIESKSAFFTCGGSIPLKAEAGKGDNESPTTMPITLRWDSADSNAGISKLTFPVSSEADGLARLQQLSRDCQPASFGYQGSEVLDETYRKATKMDRSAFCVDFCPYECGIIDTIAQLLLPVVHDKIGIKGVKAELYKLNIFTAPSGFFKAHVDTPRSSSQFASLVVSLPCYHKGGQLVVRHADNSKTFDWATPSDGTVKPEIQWAAFYSDCEHEVLEVTEGHRITLTYNLYCAPGLGDLTGNSPSLDAASLPLFQYMQGALKNPAFMPNGGSLGIHCRHAYAHTVDHVAATLPGILKGSDMVIFSILKKLGLNVEVLSALDAHADRDGGVFDEQLKDYLEDDNESPCVYPNAPTFLGPLGRTILSDAESGQGCDEYVIRDWVEKHPVAGVYDVTWVNTSKHTSLEMVHIAYGNQPSLDYVYSSAVLIVDIRPAKERGADDTMDISEN